MLSCDEQLIKTENKLITAIILWVPSYRKIKKTITTSKSKHMSITSIDSSSPSWLSFNILDPTSLYEIFQKLSHNFNFILIIDVYVIPKLTT